MRKSTDTLSDVTINVGTSTGSKSEINETDSLGHKTPEIKILGARI